MNRRFLQLGLGNVRSKLAELLYLKTPLDRTRPVQVYGLVNTRCNARCVMCDYWRDENPAELPAAVWVGALKSLRSFAGTFHINFSGGEPLLKADFFDILQYCKGAGISAGFTTNGMLLTGQNIRRIVEIDPFNVNISVDSTDESVHDAVRGTPGLLARVRQNIDRLIEYRDKADSRVRIILKTIVFDRNVGDLDKIVHYASQKGLTGVNFQPVLKWTGAAEEMFNVDKRVLAETVDKLLAMKKDGWAILNPAQSIRQWPMHFDESLPSRTGPCVVALRNMTISANGDIYLCGLRESIIGNIQDGDVGRIWRSSRARKMRKTLVACNRLCTATCVVKRNWRDYARLFFHLRKG